MADEVPEGRCGFVLEPGDVEGGIVEEYETESSLWFWEGRIACCWREVWDDRDTDHCIWHAAVDEKSVDEIIKKRGKNSERLDGAYLRGVELGGAISLKNCRMWGADFGNSNLRRASLRDSGLWSTNLRGADLQSADLGSTDLRYADLRDAGFSGADLGGANLWRADLKGADFWGADLGGANLTDADLRGANLKGAHLRGTDFRSADLRDVDLWSADLLEADLGGADLREQNLRGTSLLGADLTDADLTDADLAGAVLTGAVLRDADLTDTNLRNADLKAATLEDAILTRTDLRGADLEYAELYQTLFSDIRMNNRTEFGETCQYEARDVEPQIDDDDDPNVTPLEAAAWTYRRIQTLHEENALAQDAREFHVKKAEAYRKLRWREFVDVWSKPHRDPWNWFTTLVHALTYSINGRVSRHAESPHRVVGVSLLVIFGSAILYPLLGGIEQPPTPDGTPTVIAFDLLPSIPIPLPGPIADLATSLYFSVVTFTTLGYGDLQPASGAAQALATVESFTGALLMALLVFVLGRRATW